MDGRSTKGIGKQLIQSAMELEGVERIIAQTDDDAIDFYRKCGFSEEKNIIRYHDGSAVRYNCVLTRLRTGGTGMAELWDAYDRDFTKIEGVTLIRGEEIPEGCYHLVCEIIVKHIDGTYLLMQRDKRKLRGGMWEATAGGSALQGEDPLTCAIRELKEETGIVSDNLIEIGRVLHHGHRTHYVDYLCNTDVDKDSITLQEGETSAYKWVTRDELRRMSREELSTQRIQNFIEELR